MICPKCNWEVSDENNFCPNCGENMESNKTKKSSAGKKSAVKCLECGATIDDGDNHCNQCGTKVGEFKKKMKSNKSVFAIGIFSIIVSIMSFIFAITAFNFYAEKLGSVRDTLAQYSSYGGFYQLASLSSNFIIEEAQNIINLFLFSGIGIFISIILAVVALYWLHKKNKLSSIHILIGIGGIIDMFIGCYMIYFSEYRLHRFFAALNVHYSTINDFSTLGVMALISGLLLGLTSVVYWIKMRKT